MIGKAKKDFSLYSSNSTEDDGRQIGWDCDISWLAAANCRNARGSTTQGKLLAFCLECFLRIGNVNLFKA